VVDLVPVDPDHLVDGRAYSQVFGEGKLVLTCWFYGTQGQGDLKQYLLKTQMAMFLGLLQKKSRKVFSSSRNSTKTRRLIV